MAINIDFYLVSADRRARRLLPNKVYGMGRDPAGEIPIQDALISRRHAELVWSDDTQWTLVDCNSRNGVLVNGEKVEGSRQLVDGDQFQLGGQVFNYYLVPPNSDLGTISQQAPEISSQVTMAPGMNLSSLAAASSAFSGEISNGLPELIQFFIMTRKTGRLDLADKNASVWLIDGIPRDASVDTLKGYDALISLSSNPGSQFAFFADEMPAGAPTIDGSADGILMELARVMDEGNRS